MRGEFVCLVKDNKIPTGGEKFFLQLLVTSHLIKANNQVIMVIESISTRGSGFQCVGKDMELQTELFIQLVAPLLDKATRRYHENPSGVGPHDELANVKTRHDRLACAGIVGKHEAQGLAWQHRFINRRNLVREWVNIRCVNSHHRIEKEREINTLCLHSQLEGFPVPIKTPWMRSDRLRNRFAIGLRKKALFY